MGRRRVPAKDPQSWCEEGAVSPGHDDRDDGQVARFDQEAARPRPAVKGSENVDGAASAKTR